MTVKRKQLPSVAWEDILQVKCRLLGAIPTKTHYPGSFDVYIEFWKPHWLFRSIQVRKLKHIGTVAH